MTDKERDELKEVIRKDYPGISEAEISFMVSFFEMMQAKTAAYSTVVPVRRPLQTLRIAKGLEMPEEPKARKNQRPTGWWTQANHRRLTYYTLPSNNVLSRCSDG